MRPLFEQLYTRHQAGLYRFVRRLLGSALNAQVDEVFQGHMAARRQRASQVGTARARPFETWLYTLAHNRVIDMLRRSGREVSIDAFDSDSTEPWEPQAGAWQHWPAPASAAPHSEELAFWRRAGEKLLACLDQLPLPAAQRLLAASR